MRAAATGTACLSLAVLLVLVATPYPGAGGRGHAQLFDAIDLSGAELFARYCAACHGVEGRGDGPVAANLRTAPPNLRRIAARNDGSFPAADIRQVIDGRAMGGAHGTREMPIWGYEFWVEEGAEASAEARSRQLIERLVSYIDSIQELQPPQFEIL